MDDPTCADCGSFVEIQGDWSEGDKCWQCLAQYDLPLLKKLGTDLCDMVEHAIAMDVFTPGGSNLGWATRATTAWRKQMPEKPLDDEDREETCTACAGSGYYDSNGSPPCGACDGKGVTTC